MNFNKKTYKELDKNNFIFVKYGLLIISTILVLIILALLVLKIENESILSQVFSYYFGRS